MANHQWKEVPTHNGYFVNVIGQIRGPSGKTLKPMVTQSGHLYVLTPQPRRPRKLFLHRAVAFAFLGPPCAGQEVRHLNGTPADNRVENLAWGTRLENSNDKRIHGTQPRGEKSGTAKLTQSQVVEIRNSAGEKTLRALGEQYGVSHTCIRRAIIGRNWGQA